MIQITAYKCDHCKHLTVSKSGTYKHISKCFSNPVMKTCKSCKHKQGLECNYDLGFTTFCEKWEVK